MQIIYNYKKNTVIASGFSSVLKLLEMKSDLACKVHARRCVKLLKLRYQVRSCNLNLSGRISYTWPKRTDYVVCGRNPVTIICVQLFTTSCLQGYQALSLQNGNPKWRET